MRETIAARGAVLARKPFLQALYREWYALIGAALGGAPGPVLEIGSGPGFLDTTVRSLFRTDVAFGRGLDGVVDGTALPFRSATLGGIAGLNVFHHLPQPGRFLCEALRCVRPGGTVVLLEPWNTPWSSLCMRLLHHERFDPRAGWGATGHGDLALEANNALAWIVFHRDRELFATAYPSLRLLGATLLMPFAYLLSGGIHRRVGAPGWMYPLVRGLERLCEPILGHCAMFALIVLRREDAPASLTSRTETPVRPPGLGGPDGPP